MACHCEGAPYVDPIRYAGVIGATAATFEFPTTNGGGKRGRRIGESEVRHTSPVPIVGTGFVRDDGHF
jgi:hypothetical protein